jgi:molybdenum cofactor synthesis domain-containing protein
VKEIVYTAAVLTVSDKAYSGQREDLSGPAVCAKLVLAGFDLLDQAIVPDDEDAIASRLQLWAAREFALIVTTGGTGFSPRDITPEATISVCSRLAPGLAEAMRSESMKLTKRAALSRAVAGICGKTLIINLPGSPKAAVENLSAIIEIIPHGLQMLRGETEH